jgi:hypothetical protein
MNCTRTQLFSKPAIVTACLAATQLYTKRGLATSQVVSSASINYKAIEVVIAVSSYGAVGWFSLNININIILDR